MFARSLFKDFSFVEFFIKKKNIKKEEEERNENRKQTRVVKVTVDCMHFS